MLCSAARVDSHIWSKTTWGIPVHPRRSRKEGGARFTLRFVGNVIFILKHTDIFWDTDGLISKGTARSSSGLALGFSLSIQGGRHPRTGSWTHEGPKQCLGVPWGLAVAGTTAA